MDDKYIESYQFSLRVTTAKMMKYNCILCGKTVSNRHHGIQCDIYYVINGNIGSVIPLSILYLSNTLHLAICGWQCGRDVLPVSYTYYRFRCPATLKWPSVAFWVCQSLEAFLAVRLLLPSMSVLYCREHPVSHWRDYLLAESEHSLVWWTHFWSFICRLSKVGQAGTRTGVVLP